MKNVLIAVFAGMFVISLGYIAYDKFNEKETTCPPVNVETECIKDVCDSLYGNDDNITLEEEKYDSYLMGSVYVNESKSYELYRYELTNMENGKLTIEWVKNAEMKDGILYINNKKIGAANVLYVTNDYVFVVVVGIVGDVFTHVIDTKGNVTNLENNQNYGEVQASNVYLKETGDLVAVGSKYCGIECVGTTEIVTFKNNNGKLEIIKTKLK